MKRNLPSGFTLVEIMIVVAIMGLLAAIAVPSFRHALRTAQKQTCAINRKYIDGAKLQWATANRLPASAIPADTDLFGAEAYIEHKPDCPAGGAYALKSVAEKCTCSQPLHANAPEE